MRFEVNTHERLAGMKIHARCFSGALFKAATLVFGKFAAVSNFISGGTLLVMLWLERE